MRRNRAKWLLCGALIVGVVCPGLCVSVVSKSEKGAWPDSWPKALEPYRAQAKTYVIETAYLGTTNETAHEIDFDQSDDFEKAWPAILQAKDKGAPVILSSSPSFHDVLTGTVKAGVRIRCASGGTVKPAEGKALNFGAPWPDSAKLPSGILPEYVTVSEAGTWVPYDGSDQKDILRPRWKARTEIELVVDGKIVDLNRIRIPADTPIIDRRKLTDATSKSESDQEKN